MNKKNYSLKSLSPFIFKNKIFTNKNLKGAVAKLILAMKFPNFFTKIVKIVIENGVQQQSHYA